MIIRYYPDTLLSKYPFESNVRDISFLPVSEQQDWVRAGKPEKWLVGNMDEERYQRLKDDIAEHGMKNPLIVIYDKELKVNVGHNRACALRALKITRGPALFVVPDEVKDLLPDDPHSDFPVNSSLLSNIRAVWCEVLRARDDETDECLGIPDAWMDSNLLSEIVRSTLEDPHQLQRR